MKILSCLALVSLAGCSAQRVTSFDSKPLPAEKPVTFRGVPMGAPIKRLLSTREWKERGSDVPGTKEFKSTQRHQDRTYGGVMVYDIHITAVDGKLASVLIGLYPSRAKSLKLISVLRSEYGPENVDRGWQWDRASVIYEGNYLALYHNDTWDEYMRRMNEAGRTDL